LGQLEIAAHKVASGKKAEFDSRSELFERTASRERFKSDSFRELELDFATDMTDRKAASRLNRLRREPGGIIPTTLRNSVEREGMAMQRQKEALAEKALRDNGFTADAKPAQPDKFVKDEQKHIAEETVQMAAEARGIEVFEVAEYEDPATAANISIDDVCVKRQGEMRPRDAEKEQPKRVNNTVVHVQQGDRSYLLNAESVPGAIRILIGLLLNSRLLSKQIVIFTDGARDIHSWIAKMLSFANFKIILDWYHLGKKCREQLSMIMKGSEARNAFLDKLLPCLWRGDVSGAIRLLDALEPEQVRNQALLKKLAEYLERVRACIPNYELRKELGLRNSSNLGEKANDLLVAARQKHNGMSWSNSGSLALAAVTASSRNGELAQYIRDGCAPLQLPLAA
jgi:hypothetical protein